MKKMIGATQTFENIMALKSMTTRRQLAEFFGVGPSAVSDWAHRNANRIPEKRLAEAARRHGLRWQWLAYGEGPPYESERYDEARDTPLDPGELDWIARIKDSPAFRHAVERLLALDEGQLKLIARLAASLKEDTTPPRATADKSAPFTRRERGFPLTNGR